MFGAPGAFAHLTRVNSMATPRAKAPVLTALRACVLMALQARPARGTPNALCRNERQCPPLFRGGGPGNADHLPARVRGRPYQLGAADALLLARAPLHRLFRARLHTVRRATIRGRLYLQALLYRRARGARPPQDPARPFRRAVDGILFVAAYRPERAGAGVVDDVGGRRLRLEPREPRCLPPAVPGQCRTI